MYTCIHIHMHICISICKYASMYVKRHARTHAQFHECIHTRGLALAWHLHTRNRSMLVPHQDKLCFMAQGHVNYVPAPNIKPPTPPPPPIMFLPLILNHHPPSHPNIKYYQYTITCQNGKDSIFSGAREFSIWGRGLCSCLLFKAVFL